MKEKIIDTNYSELKLTRDNRVSPLSATSTSIQLSDDNIIHVDPNLLFQQICVTELSDVELRYYF